MSKRGRNRRGKGEGSIYQRADGYWVGSVEAGWQWSDAKQKMVRRQARVVRKRRADVVEALDKLRRQVGAGVVPDRRRTVGEYLDWWLANVAPGQVKQSSLENYQRRARLWVKPYVGTVRMVNLRKAHVAAMMTALADKSAGSRAGALSLLRQVMDFAVGDGELVKNPCDGIESPEVEPKRDDMPTDDEVDRILATSEAENHWLHPAFVLVAKYGLRNNEVRSLRWSDIDFEAGTVTIRRDTTKSKNGARTAPLLPEIKAMLVEYRKRQAAKRLECAKVWSSSEADRDLVFVNERTGKKVSGERLRAGWHGVCKRAGVRRCRLHAGRHYTVSFLYGRGLRIEEAAAIIGDHVNTVRRTYLHFDAQQNRDAFLRAHDAA